MTNIPSSPVSIQTSSQSVPSTPPWFGEVAVIAQYLQHLGVLAGVEGRVRFARRRFGHYDLIDFTVVLLGYAISGERTLEAFYERVQPFAHAFMALFGRECLPHRSTLSRFLAALNQAAVEVLRTVFLEDLVARPLEKVEKTGGLWDRQGNHWVVFDVDGTRQAARQRALPSTPNLPPAQRRLNEVCAPGYTGRKRGETVRTRTTMLQAHTHQWLGTFSGASGAGNGDYRGELRQAITAIRAYLEGVLATWDIRSKNEAFVKKIADQKALEAHFSGTDIPSSQHSPVARFMQRDTSSCSDQRRENISCDVACSVPDYPKE
jgi:hypothetical protein